MKYTTTLIDIVTSLYNNNCYSEFENKCKNQITFFDKSYNYISKLQQYNDSTHNFLTKTFFNGYTLSSQIADKSIKKVFFNRFLYRQINAQTYDVFLSKLISVFVSYNDILSFYYDNIEKYLQVLNENNLLNESENVVQNRSLYSTLPQTELNLDLNNDILDYGDTNSISKNLNNMKGKTKNTLSNYDFNKLNYLYKNNLVNQIMTKIDKECFLQTW